MKKVFVILLALVMVACGSKSKEEPKVEEKIKEQKAKNVKVMEIEQSDITRNNISSGLIEARNEVAHITETGGDIEVVNFKNGDRIKAGDVVLILENQEVKSTYQKSEAEYESAVSDLETDGTNYNKYSELYKENLIAEDEYLEKKNDYVKSKSNVKVKKAEYELALEDYKELVMVSKISGIVTDMDVKRFQKLGTNVNIFTVVDDEKMRIKTGVYGEEINTLEIGNKATIKPEGLEKVYEGKVYEINPVADEVTKKYEVKVEVENSEMKLKKGMYSEVLIETGTRTGYLVPKGSIIIKDLYSYVFLIEDGIAKRVRVENGYTQGDHQEILSDEFEGNLTLVVDGQFLLENNEKVNILD